MRRKSLGHSGRSIFTAGILGRANDGASGDVKAAAAARLASSSTALIFWDPENLRSIGNEKREIQKSQEIRNENMMKTVTSKIANRDEPKSKSVGKDFAAEVLNQPAGGSAHAHGRLTGSAFSRRVPLAMVTTDGGVGRGGRRGARWLPGATCMMIGVLFGVSLLPTAAGIRYYFCDGGDMDTLSCQGLADTITCTGGGTCIEDIYIDPCGNGFRLSPEECDDGNPFDGDGCSSTCTIERGFDCAGGSSSSADVCSVVCGDGFQIATGCCDGPDCSKECNSRNGCDDGNSIAGDGCSETCSIESGFECWGGGPDSKDICLCTRNMVSAAFTHSCGIDKDYKLVCWGNNDKDKTSSNFDPMNGGTFAWPQGQWSSQDLWVTVASGAFHNCALKYTGFMLCWGWIGPSLLGDGRIFLPPAPDWERNSAGGFTWAHVYSGFGYTCGVMDEARFEYRPACGHGEEPGQTCAQTSKDRCEGCRAPDDWSTDWLQRHPCYLSFVDQANCAAPHNRTVLCWGESFYGQGYEFPVRSDWEQVDAGSFHACGVTSDGEGHCWGNNDDHQLDVPDIGGLKWIQITAGGAHSCGIDSLFKVHCWGRYLDGQTSPPCDDNWLRVDAGQHHTCGLSKDGSLQCWGSNQAGQCKVPALPGHCTNRSVGVDPQAEGLFSPPLIPCDDQSDCQDGKTCEGPVKKDWTQVSAGELHTCATDEARQVWCWGSNQNGQTALPGGKLSPVGTASNGQTIYLSNGFQTGTCL